MDAAPRNLSILFLRTVWVFQAVLAGPIFVYLGLHTIGNLIESSSTMYYFIMYLFTSLLAGSIVLLVLVQRKISHTPKRMTILFELGKSVIATVFWLWWLLDAIFGPDKGYHLSKKDRVEKIAIAVVFLFIFFYPSLAFACKYIKTTDPDEGKIRLGDDDDIDDVDGGA